MARRPDPIDIAAQQREREQAEVEEAFIKGMTTLRDLIAPSSLQIHSTYFRIGTKIFMATHGHSTQAGCRD